MLAAGRGGEDSIEGGPGNDDILGGFQAEVITAGDGRDDVDGGGGNDIIQARDKQRDTIFCGGGDDDYVFVDDADVYSGCENVYP